MSATIISYGDLTNYGPGKFNKEIDQIPYAMAGNGFCSWVGEAEYTGCYTFVDMDFVNLPSDLTELAATMDPDDLAFLAAQYGAITYENNLGFVTVEYYADKETFDKWCRLYENEIEEAYADMEEEEEEEEEEEHIHVWGPVETSRFAGTPHRRCEGCGMVSLDLDEEEEDDDSE